MSSVAQRPDGSYGFTCYDGLPLGHELASARPTDVVEQATALQLALQGVIDDSLDESLLGRIDMQYRQEFQQPVEENIVRRLARASLPDLQEFCASNVARHLERQEAMRSAESHLIANALERADRLRKIGYIPAHAVTVYEQAIDRLPQPVHPIDFFGAGYYHGHCNPQGVIGLYGQYVGQTAMPTQPMLQAHFHELTHWAGYTSGGFTRINDADRLQVLVEEAFVQHSVQISNDADEDAGSPYSNVGPNIVHVIDRTDEPCRGRRNEREVLHLLIHHGKEQVDIFNISEAFYADRTAFAGLRQRVFSQLDQGARRLFTDYRQTGLRGLEDDYVARYNTDDAASWLTPILSAAWHQIMDQQDAARQHSATSTDVGVLTDFL